MLWWFSKSYISFFNKDWFKVYSSFFKIFLIKILIWNQNDYFFSTKVLRSDNTLFNPLSLAIVFSLLILSTYTLIESYSYKKNWSNCKKISHWHKGSIFFWVDVVLTTCYLTYRMPFIIALLSFVFHNIFYVPPT